MTIKYEKNCTECEGNGLLWEGAKSSDCSKCEGKGKVLTDDGIELIRFLHEHADLDKLLRLLEK